MSAAKKHKNQLYPSGQETHDEAESLRQIKIEAENLREKLQHSILDNPKLAKKAALLIALWANQEKPIKSRRKKAG